MKLIVGLGNPGDKYKNNRHNVGHMVVDQLKSGRAFKTDTFMNDSGDFVSKLIKNYKLEIKNLYVVHDDLDIKLGEYKIQFAVGPKVHNGIASIEESLGTKDFWRVRVGIDNRDPENRTNGEDYVLDDFTAEEREILAKVIHEICKKLETL